MKYTTNYNFNKPEATDPYSTEDYNINFDIIDTKLKENAANISSVSSSVASINSNMQNYYNKTQVDNGLSGKVDKVSGKGLSSTDVTQDEKNNWNSKANGVHTHSKAQITDFAHTHTASQITDLDLSSILNRLTALEGKKVIKSIQKGMATINASDVTTITFNNVNLDNTQFYINSQLNQGNGGGITGYTSNTLTIRNTFNSSLPCYWEVTEYYA